MRYLLVDDSDGRVLTELDAQHAIRFLARRDPEGPPVSIVRVDENQGSLAGFNSLVAVRPLRPWGLRRRQRARTAARRGPRLDVRGRR